MNPQKITEQVKNNEAILLDVREDYEWNDGHILNAKHVPLGNLNELTTRDFSKDLPIYIYCRSGGRAGVAESILKDLGFEKAENIGGIINWQDEGGELVK
jgi:rhodanese-related sulfurtransferase